MEDKKAKQYWMTERDKLKLEIIEALENSDKIIESDNEEYLSLDDAISIIKDI